VRRLRAWHAAGITLYVYSSGSVEAQRLYFAHTDHGDLTALFSGHFDTTTGPKKEAAPYRVIAESIGMAPGAILFLSDVAAELDAAAAAGMATTWLVRDGEPPAAPAHPLARDFDQVPVTP
jgi:enolase-phosphatase E1